MKQLSKVWHYFIAVKLMPTTNFSAVLKESAALTYATQLGKLVDMGQVIQDSILHGSTPQQPGFITPHIDLCKKARVKWTLEEEVLQCKQIIDDDLISSMKDTDDASATNQAPSAKEELGLKG